MFSYHLKYPMRKTLELVCCIRSRSCSSFRFLFFVFCFFGVACMRITNANCECICVMSLYICMRFQRFQSKMKAKCSHVLFEIEHLWNILFRYIYGMWKAVVLMESLLSSNIYQHVFFLPYLYKGTLEHNDVRNHKAFSQNYHFEPSLFVVVICYVQCINTTNSPSFVAIAWCFVSWHSSLFYSFTKLHHIYANNKAYIANQRTNDACGPRKYENHFIDKCTQKSNHMNILKCIERKRVTWVPLYMIFWWEWNTFEIT